MKIQDKLFLIKKRFLEKKNIILMIVLTILLIIIYSCLSVIFFINDYQKSALQNNYGYRELYVLSDSNNYELLNNIEHVDFYYDFKLRNILYNEVSEFDYKDIKGEIAIEALKNKNDVEIVDGRNIEKPNEMICAKVFYPYSSLNIKNKTKIYYDKYLDGADYIGKKINVKPKYYEEYEEKRENEDFVIVGTYQNKSNLGTVQTCYIGTSDFDRMYTDIESVAHYVTDGVSTYDLGMYEGVVVRVDKIENLEIVAKKIKDLGFGVINIETIDTHFINLLLWIPILITIVILVVAFNLIYSFLVKKNRYNSSSLGILKSIGYTNDNILKINGFENFLIINFSIFISLILYLTAFYIISKWVVYDFVYSGYFIKIPISFILIVIIILNIMIILLTIIITKKFLKNSIRNMLEEK